MILRLLILLLFLVVFGWSSPPVHGIGNPVDQMIKGGVATRDVHIRYHPEWAAKGYWLVTAPDEMFYVDGGEGGVILPPSMAIDFVKRIIHTKIHQIHMIGSQGEFSINSVLRNVQTAVVSYFQDNVKNEMQLRLGSFGLLIKDILPSLYQPRLINDFNVMGLDPVELGRGLMNGLLHIVWALSLLLILTDIAKAMGQNGYRPVIFEYFAERIVIWVIGVMVGLNAYPLITGVYNLAGDFFSVICAAGDETCAIGDELSNMFYGAGANSTSFLVGAAILIGGIVILAAGVIFFLIRALLAFILVFFAPLGVGFASLPPLQIISEIWLKMVGAFMGVNLVYALMGMALSLIDREILAQTGEATAIVRMLTAIAFGIASAAGMIFVLKKSFVLLKIIAKTEIIRLQMQALRGYGS